MKKRVLFATIAVVLVASAMLAVILMNAPERDKIAGNTFETAIGRSCTTAIDANRTTDYG